MICKEIISTEVWRDIVGFEWFYQISSHGRLKSFKCFESGKIMKLTNKKGDYFSVVLQAGGKKRHARIHRLVAEAFLFNLCDYTQVNHIDGDKQNNLVDNLEWCSPRRNVLHSMSLHPHQMQPMINYNKYIRPKTICQFDKRGNLLNRFANSREAARSTGICARNILQVCSGDRNELGYLRKSAGGYIWRFESEVMQ